ncbi:MAG TPA: inorganic phosphate transporter [Flavobacteriales bacterium]|nr:inorganic phosphate transporter [Flavobacteriales bacterium]
MTFLVVIIILALVFDYINGFHDAANSIATVVSTKVLTPLQAVIWAALFNFAAFFIFSDHAVANTISKTVVSDYITLNVIFAGLLAAIGWNLLTWWYGIPSSSSHTLIGGFAGAALMHAFMSKGETGFGNVVEMDKILKTVFFIFLAPIIGMVISMFITTVTVMRNTWIRIAIIVLSTAVTWFMFDKFEQNKLSENMEKFFKVDKYKKELAKDPSKEEVKEKLEKAKKNFADAKPFLKDYNSLGAEGVAKKISEKVSLKDLEVSKLKDAVSKLIKFEYHKHEAFYDAKKKPYVDSLAAKLDEIKPMLKQFHDIGPAKLAQQVGPVFLLRPDEIKKLEKDFDIDINKDLEKEIKKADNSILMWGIIFVIAIFVCTYIYVEKIKDPNASRMAKMFKRLQLLSSAAFSIGHGGNDAQKVMGIIAAALIANGTITDIKNMPDWVPLACYSAIALGTLSGGWKIIKTMGTKITKVSPLEGVTAETSGAMTLFMTEQMGIPVSTTHTITGSIIGVGATKRMSAVRWGVTVNLLFAWILTIPISALAGAIFYWITSLFI